MKRPQDLRRTPILSVLIERPQTSSYGTFGSVRAGFRYWSDEMNRLQYYGDHDYRFTKKFALGNFYLKYSISGDRPERGDDASYCPEIEYENLYRLNNEDHVKAMAKTLLHFKAKLKPLGFQTPYPHFSRYVEEAAIILNIKEAVLDDGNIKMPLSNALGYMKDTAWKIRQRCLVLDRNQTSEGYAQKWCDRKGYSKLQSVDGRWWAIPPSGVMPECIESALAF